LPVHSLQQLLGLNLHSRKKEGKRKKESKNERTKERKEERKKGRTRDSMQNEMEVFARVVFFAFLSCVWIK
jgi:hypothetical protein